MSADPLIVAQAAIEVDIARRQTQEIYDQASREIAATRALAQEEVLRQTQEVYHQASQEVGESRAVVEREFHRLQSQVMALMGVIESQKPSNHLPALNPTRICMQKSPNLRVWLRSKGEQSQISSSKVSRTNQVRPRAQVMARDWPQHLP